jgi:hypothetical protein
MLTNPSVYKWAILLCTSVPTARCTSGLAHVFPDTLCKSWLAHSVYMLANPFMNKLYRWELNLATSISSSPVTNNNVQFIVGRTAIV